METITEPTQESLGREFPAWRFWAGVNGLVYGRRPLTSPPAVVRGEDWLDLRDMVRAWEVLHS